MILRIGNIEFVLTAAPAGEQRPVIVVREIGTNAGICVDMTKQQAATLADAIKALSK